MSKPKRLMAMVKGPDGKITLRPVQESRSTHKVTDHIRDSILRGKSGSRDISKEYLRYMQNKKRT